MTRPALVTANRTQALADAVTIVELVSIAFPSPLGTLRLASGNLDVTFGGNTYLANGTLGEAAPAEETTDLRPRTVALTLSGARPDLIAALRAGNWQGVAVQVWIGFLNAAGQLVADPYPCGADLRASSATISLDAGRASIDMELEGAELYLLRPSQVLATNAAQQQRYAGDTGFSKVAAIANMQISWGGRTQQVGGTYDPFGLLNRRG